MVPEIAKWVKSVRHPSISNQDFGCGLLLFYFRYQQIDIHEVAVCGVLIDAGFQIGQAFQQNGLDSDSVEQGYGGFQFVDDRLVPFAIGAFDGQQEIGDLRGGADRAGPGTGTGCTGGAGWLRPMPFGREAPSSRRHGEWTHGPGRDHRECRRRGRRGRGQSYEQKRISHG